MNKLMIALVAIGGVALGAWTYVSQGPSGGAFVFRAYAAVMAANLIFSVWLWFRAGPDSGDAMILPGHIALLAVILIGIVPRLLWPEAERLQEAASAVSLVLAVALLVKQFRDRRRLRARA